MGLLCTTGMLNGVFGKDEFLHIAHWKSVKFTDHWEEEEEEEDVQSQSTIASGFPMS